MSDPLSQVTFRCGPCQHRFEVSPARIEEAPERAHPHLYFAVCPRCGEEAEQASWEKALMASYGKHTGPKTPAGLARAAANLAGHPTSEEARRTRFNALKHGMFAETATYFPARPGKYAECEGCEHRHSTCHQQDACLKQTELFMRYHIAYENDDPGVLSDVHARTQALVQWTVNQMFLSIIQTGVELRNPEYFFDPKGGEIHLVYFVDEQGEKRQSWKISAHPLLKVLAEFLGQNKMSLADFGMTRKAREEKGLVEGFLEETETTRESLDQYAQQQSAALERLTGLIERSRERTQRDPVLIEYQAGEHE